MQSRIARCCALPVLLILAWPAQAAQSVYPVAVQQGRSEVVLETPHQDQSYLLIVGALSNSPGPFAVNVHHSPTEAPVSLTPPPKNAQGLDGKMREIAERQAQARLRRPPETAPAPLREPAARKLFYLFTGDRDFHDAKSYTTVTGKLRAVGKHCQVYVDGDDPAAAGLEPTITDAVRTFDEDVYPGFAAWGRALDVDRDGRFTLLFSHRLGKLQNGRVAVSGFVRGCDFVAAVRPPFGNGCDLMYLNSDLKPGPHLRTILVHEYTHAVLFNEHVFGNYLPGAARDDEESWLNEGLAHLAEEKHGHGWSNLDERISEFLKSPERFGLVVADYYAAGTWRLPGPRGAAFLFVRWCRERFGPDLAIRLVQSNLNGVANLEAATLERFPDLFRAWCVALATDRDALPWKQPVGFRYELRGPHMQDLAMTKEGRKVELAGTSAAYFRLQSPGQARTRLVITGPVAADLQVTLIALPR